MTTKTPIERGAEALTKAVLAGSRTLSPGQASDAAQTAYESIDNQELATVIAEHLATASGWPGRGDKMLHNATPIAQAVKNWLTGKEPQ